MKSKKVNNDHIIEGFNGNLSPFMKRYYLEESENAGGNKNNQISINHGIQVVALKARRLKGIKTEKLYPNIRH